MSYKPREQHCDRSECSIACAIDLVGDSWTLIIIRDMLFCGKHEYREFMDTKEGISTNILSDRLKKLLDHKVIDVIPHPDDKKRKLYYLTQSGKDFFHVVSALALWADKHLDGAEIRPEIKEKMTINRNAIYEETMASLKEWEQENL